MIKEEKFLMEEFHRREWIPLLDESKKKQRHVLITQEQAEALNKYQDLKRIRYVKDEVKEIPKLDLETVKRPEMMSFCKENNIDFEISWKVSDFKDAISKFQDK